MRIVRMLLLVMAVLALGCCTTQTPQYVGSESPVQVAQPVMLQKTAVDPWIEAWSDSVHAALETTMSDVVTVGMLYDQAATVTMATLDALGWTELAIREGSRTTWRSVISVGLNAGRSSLILAGVYDRRIASMEDSVRLTIAGHVTTILLESIRSGLSDGTWTLGELLDMGWAVSDSVLMDLDLNGYVLRPGTDSTEPLLLAQVLDVAQTTIHDSLLVFDVLDLPLAILSD